MAVAPVEYNGCKINVLDTPAWFRFLRRSHRGSAGDQLPSSSAPPRGGMSVGAESLVSATSGKLPRIVWPISKTDEEELRYNATLSARALLARTSRPWWPLQIWDAPTKKVIGIIDVSSKRAFEAGTKGDGLLIDVPADKLPVLNELLLMP